MFLSTKKSRVLTNHSKSAIINSHKLFSFTKPPSLISLIIASLHISRHLKLKFVLAFPISNEIKMETNNLAAQGLK